MRDPMKPIKDYEMRGSFAAAIVEAWTLADSHNKGHIESVWHSLFEPDLYRCIVDEAEKLTAHAAKLGVKFNYSVDHLEGSQKS